jgi:hypothetical protein
MLTDECGVQRRRANVKIFRTNERNDRALDASSTPIFMCVPFRAECKSAKIAKK